MKGDYDYPNTRVYRSLVAGKKHLSYRKEGAADWRLLHPRKNGSGQSLEKVQCPVAAREACPVKIENQVSMLTPKQHVRTWFGAYPVMGDF